MGYLKKYIYIYFFFNLYKKCNQTPRSVHVAETLLNVVMIWCVRKSVSYPEMFSVSTWLSCFRAAAIVIIALSRMHFLVRRWQRRYHTGSSAVLTRGLSESTLSSFHGRYTASCCSFWFHFLYSIFPAIVASYCVFNIACNCII